MIKKLIALGDWIFDHPLRLFIAAALWFAAWIAAAVLGGQYFHLLEDWIDGVFWGLVGAIMLPMLFCAVAEQLQELQGAEIYAKEERERRRMYN